MNQRTTSPAAAIRPGRAARRWPARAVGRWLSFATIALVAAGCADLPADIERTPSWHAGPAAEAPLAQLVEASTPAAGRQRSGFALIADGSDALATRVALVRGARHTLDLQTFLLAADGSGALLLRELQAAARRGVRVRLLVDDLYAGAVESRLAAFDRDPMVQVRLFNPLPARGASLVQRVLGSLHDFDRINRRMHNKLLVADGQVALAGGRNIGDEYFMRGTIANFVDLDILCTGAVVGELADLFDRFWNDPLAYPVASLAGGDAALHAEPWPAAPAVVTGAGVAAQIAQGRLALRFADVRLLADAPDKAVRPDALTRPGEAMAQALALMRAAHGEVAIASPYFVPGPTGMALLQEARDRGLQICVLTNSLGATDEPLVHGGYRRYRRAMLELGVKLAELSPLHTAPGPGLDHYRPSLGRLHAKFAVVDRRWLLVGSMNMDRRSSRLNTEFALAIDSAALAAEALDLLQALWAGPNYQPRLAPTTGRVEWLAHRGGDPVVLDREPHVGPIDMWRLPLLSLLVPEELL